MPQLEDFDTNIYFGIVADNLLANHGRQALQYALVALQKMKDIGDDEGYQLWEGVQEQLIERVSDKQIPVGATIH